MMQSGELVRFEGRSPAVYGGRDFAGPAALQRFYRTKEGWLRLQAPDVQALQRAGLVDGTCTDMVHLQGVLSERFATMESDELVACLRAAGIPAARARLPGDLPVDPELQPLEMCVTLHMEDGSPFYSTGRYARFSRTQESSVFTPPGVGEHSCEVLAEAGVEAEEIQALVDAGSVRQGQAFHVAGIQNYR